MATIYGKIKDNGLLAIREVKDRTIVANKDGENEQTITSDEQIEELIADGWKLADELEIPDCDEENYTMQATPKDTGDKIVYDYEKVVDESEIKEKIENYKQGLSDSDYKVIKCYEASLLGKSLPYDMETLHSERQAIRDEINELELLLNP